jgi:3-oxoacyl-[acyl-carrier-protein] synthase-3
MLNCKIVSTGLYMPPRVQTAAELAPLIGRSENWIVSRTGVKERRIAEEPMEVLAAKAAREALGQGPAPDLILNASTTPLQLIPDSSVYIQKELGLDGTPAWSTHATCLSFVAATVTGASMIQSGLVHRVLVVSSETGTGFRNMKQPESAALFGDGAAAAILEATPESEQSAILDWHMSTWPEGADFTEFRGAGTRRPPDGPDTKPEDNLFTMNGPRVFRLAVNRGKESLDILFSRNQLRMEDIDWLVLHHASGPAMEAFVQHGFARERVINNIAEYGNCIAASIPIALATANAEGKLKRGDLILMGGTGAGLSISFALIRW